MVKGIQKKKKKDKWKIVVKNGKRYLVFGKKRIKISSNLDNKELKKILKKYGKVLKKKIIKKSVKSFNPVNASKPEISGSNLTLAQQDIRVLQKRLEEEKRKVEEEKKRSNDLQERKRIAKEAQKIAENQYLLLLKGAQQQQQAQQQTQPTQKTLTFSLPNPTTGVMENVELTEDAAKKLIPLAEQAGWKISKTQTEANKAKKESIKVKKELVKKEIKGIKGLDHHNINMKVWIAKQLGLKSDEYRSPANKKVKSIDNILKEAKEEKVEKLVTKIAESGMTLEQYRKKQKEKKEDSEDEIENLDLDSEMKKVKPLSPKEALEFDKEDDNKKEEIPKEDDKKEEIEPQTPMKKIQKKIAELRSPTKYTVKELTLDDPLTEGEEEPEEEELEKKEKKVKKEKKPKKAKGKNSSSNGLYDNEINEMMMPYRKKGFLGTIAADEIPKLLPKVGFRKKVSFIMNTDKSSGPGKHWQGINITPETIEFYDSFGDPPTKQFMKDIEPLIKQIHPNKYLKFVQNKIKVQDDRTSNCGYFSVKWLQDRLDGKPFIDAVKTSRTRQAEKNIQKFKKSIK